MLALRRKMILSAMRVCAYMVGDKIIEFHILPREGGYSLVRSPDLPGFAMVLQPGEAATMKSLIDALTDPLTAYLEAEGKRQSAIEHSKAKKATLRGWAITENKVIAATSCV